MSADDIKPVLTDRQLMDFGIPDIETGRAIERAAIQADRASRTPSPQGDAEFEVWQDGTPVASASGPRAAALAEIEHYAAVYGQDGPVEVYEVTRTRIDTTLLASYGQAPAASAEPPYEIDALFDALSNLEHDNYEMSYGGYKDRRADLGLIRAALERHAAPVADQAPQDERMETTSEHIARDIREGRFPQRSEPQRVQATEWGPMPDAGVEADAHVAVIEGDEAVRVLRWNSDVGAFSYPVGTRLYAAQAPAANGDVREIERLKSIINSVHSWVVCSCIASAEDMAQNFPYIEQITNPDYRGKGGD